MDNLSQFMSAQRAAVTAAAGCGKTHLIARAVSEHGGQRELILTHTHAGVDALRQKLRAFSVPRSRVEIDTIAGWALRYAWSFPDASGFSREYPESSEDWQGVYGAACRLLAIRPFREIVRCSYSGVFVDEYQDCVVEQHELVLALSEVLRCRILGDPLQGIFGFGNNVLVDWQEHVETSFHMFPELTCPWRWRDANRELGDWVLDVRRCLQNGSTVDLSAAPVSAVEVVHIDGEGSLMEAQRQACRDALLKDGTVVAIHSPTAINQCKRLARAFGGAYSFVETVECSDLLSFAARFDNANGHLLAVAVIEFAEECMTAVAQEMATLKHSFSNARTPSARMRRGRNQLDALMAVVEDGSPRSILRALDSMRQIRNARLCRRELYGEMRKALSEHLLGAADSLRTSAWLCRERTRRMGRRSAKYSIGRTLLVKGLEFDHSVLLDATELEARDLYVALTRASSSVAVVTQSMTLNSRLSQ